MLSMRGPVLLVLAAFLGACAHPTVTQKSEPNEVTHGPILGRLTSSSVGVWARTTRAGYFTVRYGTNPQSLSKKSARALTTLDRDNTAWIELEGLRPDTVYHYELDMEGSPSRTGFGGSFRTLPNDEMYRDPELNPKGLFNFSFEFACGNNQNPTVSAGRTLPAFKTMLERISDKIHFAILNGDWLYEVKREFRPDQWRAQVDITEEASPEVVQLAPSIVGVWENYKHFLNNGPNMAAWHAEVPSFFTYDDHECLNDIWGAGTAGLRDRRAVFRDVGVRAWNDYLAWSNPTAFPQRTQFGTANVSDGSDVLTVSSDHDLSKVDLSQSNNLHVHWGTPDAGVNDNSLDGVGGDPNAGVYEILEVLGPKKVRVWPSFKADGAVTYSIGRRSYYKFRVGNVDFFCLDTRGQREMHDVRDPAKKGLSMLGKVQREWLLKGLSESDADFHFVVSSVNFMVPHVGGEKIREGANKDEAWTVFLDEREMLIEYFDKLEGQVFVLTGDLHNSFAIKITDNVWEFASGPHNSNNHWVSDEGDRPANGTFKYGPRAVDIRWSTYFRTDVPRSEMLHPTYCVVQINNVFNNALKLDGPARWVAFERPHVIFQYFDGRTGDLRYAEAIHAKR